MAVPKKKTSKGRKGRRQAGKGYRLAAPVPCPNCNQPRRPHRICPHCGFYRGKVVLKV